MGFAGGVLAVISELKCLSPRDRLFSFLKSRLQSRGD